MAILTSASMSNRRYSTNEMNRFFDFTPRQLTFVAVLSGTALVLGGYLFVRTHAWPLEDAPRLPVVVSERQPEYRGTFVLDPNTAPPDSLELLPGIGPALTDSIVKYRGMQRFDRVEDITRVPGIGKKTLEKLRPYLKVDRP